MLPQRLDRIAGVSVQIPARRKLIVGSAANPERVVDHLKAIPLVEDMLSGPEIENNVVAGKRMRLGTASKLRSSFLVFLKARANINRGIFDIGEISDFREHCGALAGARRRKVHQAPDLLF
jgi:hypothetical protein